MMSVLCSTYFSRIVRGCCRNAAVRHVTSRAEPSDPGGAAAPPDQPLQPAQAQSQLTQMSLPDYRFVFPEFLPDPDMTRRHRLAERVERADMLRRRAQVEIPEFYVGSIIAVTVSDPQAPGKLSRFVGICILREGHGLRATMTLRNAIDQQGVEICYPLYNPTVQKVEVLRLERRLDDDLRYLRDAPLEYSAVPLDMEPELAEHRGPVPLNDVRVPLRPRPWTWRWERADMKGLVLPELRADFFERANERSTPWVHYDLMHEYRRSIPEDDQRQAFAELHEHVQSRETRRLVRRRRVFSAPKKSS